MLLMIIGTDIERLSVSLISTVRISLIQRTNYNLYLNQEQSDNIFLLTKNSWTININRQTIRRISSK
jgi:hypothetical protein